MASVVTELTIDGSGATRGAQEYERAMDQAQRAMQRSLGAMSQDIGRAKDGIGSLGAAIGGLVTGGAIATAITVIASLSKEIAGFEQTARRASLALSDFQALRGAGALKGIAGSEFDTSVQKMAKALNDARREETDLSRLLDANNIKFKEGTKLLIDQNQALEIAANLIRRASSPQDQLKIAKAFGVEDLVPMLQGGAEALRDLTKEARQSGAVLDDEVIQRAAQFDREWTRVIASWTLRLKSGIVDVMETMQGVIKEAQQTGQVKVPVLLPNDLDTKELSKEWGDFVDFASRKWSEFLDKLGVPPDMEGFKKAVKDAVADTLSDAERLRDAFMDVSKTFKQTANVPFPHARPSDAPGATIIPGDGSKSAFDRQIESINRHTAAIEADAQAAGKSAAEHAKLRAEFQLREALVRDGITDTETQNRKLEEQADVLKRASDAAQGLAQARVQANIDFARQTAFLSPQDVQIAQQLKELYGNDVPRALESTEAAAMRVNMAMEEINKTIRNAAASFGTTFVEAIIAGKSAMEAFGAAAKAAGSSLISGGFSSIMKGDFATGVPSLGFGIALSAMAQAQQKREQRQRDSEQAQDDMRKRIQALQDRQALAGLNTRTLEGALAEFDVSAARQRQEASQAAGGGILGPIAAKFGVKLPGSAEQTQLEATLAAERLAIVKKFADDAIEQEKRRTEEVQKLSESLSDRAFKAVNDNSTLQGKLAEFDLETFRERESLERDFSELIPQLDQTRLAERVRLERDFNEQAIAAEKQALQERQDLINQAAANITQYVNSILSGPESALSASQRLSQAQAAFNSQLALAQSGNTAAAGGITQFAENLRKAARDFFGSSSGYQTIQNQIVNSLLALPAVQASTDPVVNALRDVLTASQQTRDAVKTNNDLVTSGNTIATDQKTIAADQKTIDQTVANLSTSITDNTGAAKQSLAQTVNLNTTAAGQLELLNSQLSGGTVQVTTPGFTSPFPQLFPGTPSNTATAANNMITALNKIVINTASAATTLRTMATNWFIPSQNLNISSQLTPGPAGVLHSGGWVGGYGDVPITAQAGEYVINRYVAQQNRTRLPFLNSTGDWPANDNSAMIAELRALRMQLDVALSQIARLTAAAGERVAEAVDDQTEQLKSEEKSRALRNAA